MDFNKLFSLEGKVALVTGAAYGIGFAIAEAYAKAGAKIAFNCRSQHHMDQALADYKAKGIEAKGYICDVTDEEQVKNMVADIEKELGVIDILVNNAGIIKRIPMTEMSVDDFKQVIDIDLTAPFIVSKAVIPGMIKKGHGKIINICSMMSELGRRVLQKRLAEEVTIMVHSQEDLDMAIAASNILFGKATKENLAQLDEATLNDVFANVPHYDLDKNLLGGTAVDLFNQEGMQIFPSKSEMRKLVKGGGVSLNKEKLAAFDQVVTADDLIDGKYLLVQKGKKNYFLITVK
jgi:NAD(P)-dependent dehydrogenase (short-subunit alcohol dehydrogenase family)